MTDTFTQWLNDNGLVLAFTTSAGDSLYVNTQKKFGVLTQPGVYGAKSFYLDDMIGFQTFDDEKLIAQWESPAPWHTMPRSTLHSTKEVFINIRLRDQSMMRINIFKATYGNILRDSENHVNLIHYACQISHIIYNFANSIPQGI